VPCKTFRTGSAVALLALLATALYWTVRLQYADWLFVKGDAPSIRRALLLEPGNAEYASALAQADPAHAAAILQQAVARNPRNASLHLELGLAQERGGDFPAAEASLLLAAHLDTGFAPRWALSDFYFHRRDTAKFWPAVHAALSVSYGDVSAQFRNCWALSSDPQIILARAIPDRTDVRRSYLDFLLAGNRLDAALPVWNGLAPHQLVPEWTLSLPEGIYQDGAALTFHFSGRQPEETEILSRYLPVLPHRRYILRAGYRTSGIPAPSGLVWRLFDTQVPLEQSAVFQSPDRATLGRLVLAYRRLPGATRIEGTLTLLNLTLEPEDQL
jgi:hypothetical protein